MYPKKNAKEISRILMFPTILYALIFIGGGVYLYAPYMLFPGIWCLYQACLWISAIKKKSVHCLPLYQIMGDEKFGFMLIFLYGMFAFLYFLSK